MSPCHPLQLALGLIVWSLWFVGTYGGLSVACAVASPAPTQGSWTWINAGLGLFTLLTATLLLWWAWACWRAARADSAAAVPSRRFIAAMAAGLHLVAALSTVFVGMPVAGLPPCL